MKSQPLIHRDKRELQRVMLADKGPSRVLTAEDDGQSQADHYVNICHQSANFSEGIKYLNPNRKQIGPQKSVKTLFQRVKAKESDHNDYVGNSVISSSNTGAKYEPPERLSAMNSDYIL